MIRGDKTKKASSVLPVQRRLLLAAARVTMSDKPATGVKPIFCG